MKLFIDGGFEMNYKKYTAIASLIFTIVPFVSALITNYVKLPFAQETSYKVIMFVVFILAWFILVYIIYALPNEVLQKLKLTRVAMNKVRNYWIVKYKRNDAMTFSILQICDDCGSNTKSLLQDYNNDLSLLTEMGIHSIDFNGDEQLIQACAKGGNKFSFIRFDFTHQGVFDFARIDDNGNDSPSKLSGCCEVLTPKMLQQAGICEDMKIARKMLLRFSLSKINIEALLVYITKNENTDFAREILSSYDSRRNSKVVSADIGIPTVSISKSATSEDARNEDGLPTK